MSAYFAQCFRFLRFQLAVFFGLAVLAFVIMVAWLALLGGGWLGLLADAAGATIFYAFFLGLALAGWVMVYVVRLLLAVADVDAVLPWHRNRRFEKRLAAA